MTVFQPSSMAMEQKPPLRTVAHVDLGRFMGDWYVIAIIPWFFEKNNVGTMDIYRMLPDGRIEVTYRYHRKSLDAPPKELKGTARVVNTSTNAEWKVRLIWPFEAPFLIIDLAEDYRFTVIGHPSRDLVWIMSRNPHLNATDFEGILERLKGQGYDVERIKKVPQPSHK